MDAKKKIFISHAAKDKDLADRLVDVLLNNGCDVPAAEIFCTSLEGIGIPAGTKNFIEFIHKNIQSPSLVILLLTENYFCSTFCQCELGAAWAMDLPTFPLVVPPLDKAKLKATLMVTQAGEISDSNYLDELRDAVKEKHGVEVKTARWNVKKDLFLKDLPGVLAKLPKPTQVPAAKLQEAEQKYDEALKEIQAAEKKIEILNRQIDELKALKDAEAVRKVTKKYSTTTEQFDVLCEAAIHAFDPLHKITIEALYRDLRGQVVPLDSREKSDEAVAAEDIKQVVLEGRSCTLNTDNQKVWDAKQALNELQTFVGTVQDNDFLEQFEAGYGYLPDLMDKSFWKDHLADI